MKLLAALAAVVILATYAFAAGVPAKVTYVHHDKVAAVMAKGGAIIEDPGLRILAQRRGSGEAEIHETTNHVFIIVEGEATMVTGGTLIAAKQTEPGQIRGTGVNGGQTHRLSKGDVITIPAKTPHWWRDVPTKTVAYYGVNIEN